MKNEVKNKDTRFVINTNKTFVIEPNSYCNLKCIHCYVPHAQQYANCMSVTDADILFDQLKYHGFRYILFTGGEPLAHPQFEKIYENAWDRGFVITIFSNAVLMNERYMKLFFEKKPALFRSSLFGGTPESYKDVTGFDFFGKALENIKELHRNGINVRIKIPLLVQNKNTVKSIHDYLTRIGITNKIESSIIPKYDGDTEILKYRLTPEEVIEMKLEDANAGMLKFIQAKKDAKKVRSARYCVEHCQPYIVDSCFNLQFCFFFRELSVSLRDYKLLEALELLTKKFEEEYCNQKKPACADCGRQYICQYCPGWAKNEMGHVDSIIPYLCRLTELYEQKYMEINLKGG